MPTGAQWRVRTRFRQLVVTTGRPRPGAPSTGVAVEDLLFDLRSRNPEVVRAMAEISFFLRGVHRAAPVQGVALDELVREIESALASGELVVEDTQAQAPLPLHVELIPEPPPEPEPELGETTETDFIAIEVRDEDDKPVSCAFHIKLPSGETRQVHTGSDGRARLDGITPGTARVAFPDFDQQNVEPA